MKQIHFAQAYWFGKDTETTKNVTNLKTEKIERIIRSGGTKIFEGYIRSANHYMKVGDTNFEALYEETTPRPSDEFPGTVPDLRVVLRVDEAGNRLVVQVRTKGDTL